MKTVPRSKILKIDRNKKRNIFKEARRQVFFPSKEKMKARAQRNYILRH